MNHEPGKFLRSPGAACCWDEPQHDSGSAHCQFLRKSNSTAAIETFQCIIVYNVVVEGNTVTTRIAKLLFYSFRSMSSSSSFGELVLVLGDLHIPERASKIAAPFKRMLVPNKMQHVICTGNIGSSLEQWNEIQQLAPKIHCVSGDWDNDVENATLFPETCVVQVGQFRIGVIHGHQLIPWGSKEAADRMRRKLRVDILISGHTHQSAVVDENDGFYHINPVSRFTTLC
jgi:vacuolar protein sorting-associated protein 29